MAWTSRRRWYRPWEWSTRIWFIAGFVCLALMPLTVRLFILWQVPQVTLPFDVNNVVADSVPEEQDAFVIYARMAPLMRGNKTKWSMESIEATLNDRDQREDELDEWLLKNQSAVEMYRRAGTMERAGGPSLATADNTTLLPLHNEFRRYAVMVAAEAVRRERAGDLESAWTFHHANLRCGLHAERPGFPICRLVGNSVRALGCRGIARWSEQPMLSAARLQRARDEVAHEAAQRGTVLDVAKVECVVWRNTLRRKDAADHLVPQWSTSGPNEMLFFTAKRFYLWTLGQPEYALRLHGQLMANQAPPLELPFHLRPPTLALRSPLLFQQAGGTESFRGQMTAEQLQRVFSTPLTQLISSSGIFMGLEGLDRACRVDDARLAALDVVLAAQQFQRDRGEFPADLQQLVPDYLEAVPLDPMSETGATLKYRREQSGEAIVWSLGMNELDDNAEISKLDVGYRIMLAADQTSRSQPEIPARESKAAPDEHPREPKE